MPGAIKPHKVSQACQKCSQPCEVGDPSMDASTSETPAYDALRSRYREVVDNYVGALNGGANRFNTVRSYIAAGYSERSAASNAYRMMENDGIQEAIAERLDQLAMTDLEAAAIIAEHAKGTLAHFLRVDQATGLVEIDLSSETARSNLHLVKKLRQRKRITRDASGTTTMYVQYEIDLHDAQSAAHLILKAHGAFRAKGSAADPVIPRVVILGPSPGVYERLKEKDPYGDPDDPAGYGLEAYE